MIALGTAFGTVFVLAAFVVLSIDGYDPRYTNNLLVEPGLRPGVAFACWLLLIPVLIFIAMCTRVCAQERERRYANFRLAGATARQVQLIAAGETAMATLLGTGVGLLGFLAGRAALATRTPDEGPFTLPVYEPFPWGASIVFCLLMPLLAGGVGAFAMRRVTFNPLGLVRRQGRKPPRGWPALTLLLGPLVMIVGFRFDSEDGSQILLLLGIALMCVGLLLASAWVAAAAGRLSARVAGHAALLIAARRLEADPHGQGWAMSSVIVGAFLAAGTAVLKQFFVSVYPDDDFYHRALDLVNLGILLAVGVAAAGLLVGLAEGVVERRRTLAALTAAGTPVGTLRRALVLQSLLPLVPTVLLAIVLGATFVHLIIGPAMVGADGGVDVGVPLLELALITAAAIGASLIATALALPFLHRSVRPSELRID